MFKIRNVEMFCASLFCFVIIIFAQSENDESSIKVFRRRRSYSNAVSACEKTGGSLISFKTKKISDLILKMYEDRRGKFRRSSTYAPFFYHCF